MLFLDLMFLETSAMTSENIGESFHQCARIILSKIASGLIEFFVSQIFSDAFV